MKRGVLFLTALLVVVLGVLPFLPAAGGGFVWDDGALVRDNPTVHSFEHPERWLTSDLFDLEGEAVKKSRRLVFYRPLVLATFALDHQLGGGEPGVFHLTNLLLHALAAGLSFFVARGYTKSVLGAGVAAVLFAVHPTKAESVAWISGRSDLLVSIGLLSAMLGVRARLEGRSGGHRVLGALLEVFGWFVAAASKELVVVLPVLVAFEVLRPRVGDPVGWRRLIGGVGPALVLVVLYLVFRSALLPWGSGVARVGALDHARIVLETHGRALELALWPRDLTVFRAAVRVGEEGILHSVVHEWLGALVFVASFVAALFWVRRSPLDAALALGFVLLFAPTGNYFLGGEASWIAPRFLYLPLLPVVLLVVRRAERSVVDGPPPRGRPVFDASPWASRRGSIVLAFALCVAFGSGVLGAIRSLAYGSDRAFYRSEIRENSTVPDVVLGMARLDLEEGESQLALARLACGHRALGRHFRHSPLGGRFILVGLEAVERQLYDLPPEQLLTIASFLDDVASGRPASLERPLVLAVEPDSKAAAGMLVSRSRVLLLAARFVARAGDVARAREFVAGALTSCSDCPEVVDGIRALAPLIVDFGRASDRAGAERIARAYQERALYGRALLTLAPVLRSIVESDDGKRWVAVLGAQAGDGQLADYLLARLPEAEAQAIRARSSRVPERYSPEARGGFVGAGCARADELFGGP